MIKIHDFGTVKWSHSSGFLWCFGDFGKPIERKGRLPAWGRTTFKVNELSKLLPKIRAVQVRNKKDGSLDLVVSHAWCKTERKHILSKDF